MGGSNEKPIREYAIAVTVAVVVALLVRFFLIEAYRIPSQSMKPTLLAGDTIFVSKWPFGLRLPGASTPFTSGRVPERGEIVVFTSPFEQDRDFIKRVVGVPGDSIEIRSGTVYLNGKPLETVPASAPKENKARCGSERIPPQDAAKPEKGEHGVCWEPPVMEDLPRTTVPANSVFVMGDLRSAGEGPRRQTKGDSWGMIPLTALKGSALWIWLSVEPRGLDSGWLPRFRTERMLRRIE